MLKFDHINMARRHSIFVVYLASYPHFICLTGSAGCLWFQLNVDACLKQLRIIRVHFDVGDDGNMHGQNDETYEFESFDYACDGYSVDGNCVGGTNCN